MKKYFCWILLLLPLSLYSQQQALPLLQIKNDSAAIELENLSIRIEILGNIAQTSVEMTFYNPQDRVLEGELNFPLGEGQTVSGFAMDVNGKMREGVVVEKARGRQAFETIVRGNIDPGLLEQTQGNNFKTRVYPIPAKGRKSVRIDYQEELALAEGMPLYKLVMGYGRAKNFNLKVSVFKQELAPQLQPQSGINFAFEKWEETFQAAYSAEDFEADKLLSFQIPRAESSQLYQEASPEGTYFYLNYQPEISSGTKKAPKSVALLWDQSFSGKKRDLEKELELLDAYFKKIGSLSVSLVPFALEVQAPQQFKVKGGDWSALREVLKQMPLDGATRLNALDLSAYKADEYLLFSDGLATIGKGPIAPSGKMLHTINSSQSADHALLRYLAEASGGSYLNLLKLSAGDAAGALMSSPFRFLRAEYQQGQISEVYPSLPQQVGNQFTLSGIAKTAGAEITLHFGIGNEVLHSRTFVLDKEATQLEGYLPKLWAGKKIGELSLQYEENKEEVTRLAKKFTIVTPGTSLIVLDRLEDYLRYEIVPPVELQEEYFQALKERQEEEKLGEKEVLKLVAKDYQERVDWWKTTFSKERPEKSKQEVEETGIVMDMGVPNEEEIVFEEDLEVPFTEQPPPPPAAFSAGEPSRYDANEPAPDMANRLQSQVAGVQLKQKQQELLGPSIGLKAYDPDRPYLDSLRNTARKNWYSSYLRLREAYASAPSFYLDVANFFIEAGERQQGIRILSTIAELQLENHELLRLLAHRLKQLGEMEYSLFLFEKVLEIREEEPQSYRDLALAYKEAGEYQKALDLFYQLVKTNWKADGRFPLIGSTVLHEMNHLIARHPEALKHAPLEEMLTHPLPVDVRVVLNWSTADTDMDLWVTDPYGEKCSYQNKQTAIGGRLPVDYTNGYGPEEFLLKEAIPGTYQVEVNFYGDRTQKIAGPVSIQLVIYTHYGSKKEQKKEITLQAEEEKGTLMVGEFSF